MKMTKKRLLFGGIFVVIVVIAVVISMLAFSSDESEQLTFLSSLEGDVLVMKAGTGSWAEGQSGQQLEENDIIKLGDDSRASITFFDGSTIDLEAGTQIQINNLEPGDNVNTISLEQEVGRSISRVIKLADTASNYEIETPSGVAAARGWSFMAFAQTFGQLLGRKGGLSAFNAGELERLKKTYNRSTSLNESLLIQAFKQACDKDIGGILNQLEHLLTFSKDT